MAAALGALAVAAVLTADRPFAPDHDRDWAPLVRATGPVEYHLSVSARDARFATGLSLAAGDRVLIGADGSAAYGADERRRVGPAGDEAHLDEAALMPSAPVGALTGDRGWAAIPRRPRALVDANRDGMVSVARPAPEGAGE